MLQTGQTEIHYDHFKRDEGKEPTLEKEGMSKKRGGCETIDTLANEGGAGRQEQLHPTGLLGRRSNDLSK